MTASSSSTMFLAVRMLNNRDRCLPVYHDILVFVFDEQARSHLADCGCNISMIVSHRFIAGMPSMRNPASSDFLSASVLLWETTVCFLHAHEIGTNVCDRNIHITSPELIVSLWDVLQNRRHGILQICCPLLDSQHDNAVCCQTMNVTYETCWS